MWDGFNKRKFPRLNLRCEIVIHPNDKTPPLVRLTENVGSGGVCVMLDKPLERFSHCQVRIELEEKLPPIECRGRIVWNVPVTKPKSKNPNFDTGIEFVDLQPESLGALKKFIRARTQSGFQEITS